MNEITYRKAGLNDLELLVDSRIEFMVDYWGAQEKDVERELRTSLEMYFKSALTAGTYISFIATQEKTFAGVGGMVLRTQAGSFKNPSGKVAYIMNMYTAPAFRRKGISTNLLNLLQEEGKKLGYTAFELHATQEGEPVYIKNNFLLHNEPTYRKYIE